LTDHIDERDAGSKQQRDGSKHETKTGRPSNITLDTLSQITIIVVVVVVHNNNYYYYYYYR